MNRGRETLQPAGPYELAIDAIEDMVAQHCTLPNGTLSSNALSQNFAHKLMQ